MIASLALDRAARALQAAECHKAHTKATLAGTVRALHGVSEMSDVSIGSIHHLQKEMHHHRQNNDSANEDCRAAWDALTNRWHEMRLDGSVDVWYHEWEQHHYS